MIESRAGQPLRVGFDLDGVVYDFRRALSDYLVAAGRQECSLDNARPDWDFFEGWGLTLAEYLDLYRAGVDAGYVLRVGDPLPGSVEAMRRLSEAGHSIHIVTDRKIGSDPEAPGRLTRDWLVEHGVPFNSLTMSSDKTSVRTDYFIDDRYENYTSRVNAGMSCHLLTRSWNSQLGSPDTMRVSTVDQFVDVILDDRVKLRDRMRVGAS